MGAAAPRSSAVQFSNWLDHGRRDAVLRETFSLYVWLAVPACSLVFIRSRGLPTRMPMAKTPSELAFGKQFYYNQAFCSFAQFKMLNIGAAQAQPLHSYIEQRTIIERLIPTYHQRRIPPKSPQTSKNTSRYFTFGHLSRHE